MRPINPATGRPYYYKDNPEAQARRNATRHLVEVAVGGRERFRTLSQSYRTQIRATVRARQLINEPDTAPRRLVSPYVQPVDHILRLAWKIAGSMSKYDLLDCALKAQLRLTARVLYDAGRTAGSAEDYEASHKDGFIYVMTNPAWSSAIKIGRSSDPDARERGYQTGSPYRDYKIEFSMYFKDSHAAEKNIHEFLASARLEGEWFSITLSAAINTINNYARSVGLL